MEHETSKSEPVDVSKTRKASRNKLACSIACLDGANFNINIEKNAPGKMLIEKICQHLNVGEKEYFGLLYVDHKTGQKRWLETQKPIKKQLHGSDSHFDFAVKFFEPNPEQLKNDYTRYLMALQIREEIATGGLPCSFSAQALLGSYVIQSEFGDYNPLEHGNDYLDGLVFAPEQSVELILKIKELHKTHKGLSPMEADLQYLEYARKLTLYGVDLHEARDAEGSEIHVGVSFAGIAIYKDQIRNNKFTWPTIDEVKYKGRNFFVKIKPGEYQAFISTVVFKTPSDRATKELYKSVVEHHTFYRLREPDSPKGGTLPRLHSRFRYSDRTLYQLRQGAYNSLPRPSTLTRRWSDRYSERKRPANRNEEAESVEPKVPRDEVPVTSAEPEGRMNKKFGVMSGDEKESPMDVVFTFGACGPNADEVFEKEKDMVSGFLETIKVADSYYGVIEYGDHKANIMARLGDFRNKERLNQYISTIPRSGEGRAIDKALEKGRELLLASGRRDARKALVIFANGKSSARLAELTGEAQPLHDAGVKIIAVGIGDDVDDEELNSFATNKVLAQPYDEPAPLGHLLAHEVCEAPSKELVDVSFVMGSSGVEGDAAFEKQKEVIHSFVDSLKSIDTQMAVVNYGESESNVEVKLGQFKDKEDFKSCVDKQERKGEGKALVKALGDAEKVLKQTGRPGVKKAVVVFANGKTGAEVVDLVNKARALHGADVKVVAVGLGDDVSEEELKVISNAGVILAARDQDSDVISQNILKQLDMLSDAAEDALDIVFAFGASGEEAGGAFKKEKEMINLFIDSLKVHDAQYGVIEYSSEARVHATFGQFSRKERLKAQVSSIERRGDGVGLDKALTSAYDLLMKNGRRGARKVLIVFTSGKADVGLNELRAYAKALQDAGVKIVAVAIGNNIDENQLKEVSSDEHVIHSQLTGDSVAIIQLISDDVVSAELTGEAIDIMFALGSAGVEGEMVFEKEKEMLYAFVNSVDTANVRYAMIEYAENATLQADFNEYKEKYDFKEFVDSVKRIGEGVGLDKALQRASAVFENSGRVNAKRVLVLFTNAQSKARTQDLERHSRELQDAGVKVVVVAIGTDVSEEELRNIHAEPVVRTQPNDDVNVIVKSVASDVLATEPELSQVPSIGPKIKLDVVFAVGAAGREANEIFDKEKEIVNSFIDKLKENDAQFAVIEFGNKAFVKCKLGDERDAMKLKTSVSGIQRTGEGKCLDKALEQAVQIFQNEARPASNRVLIVLTNAKSSARSQDLKKHAQSLAGAGVKVQVVAVGNEVNEEELLQVTSNELPLLRIQPYEEPQTVINNSAWIVGEKQDEYLDIVFAFGSFGETAEQIFEKEKQLISSFIDSIQKRDTRYGVIEIGPRAKICAKIGQYRDHVRLKRHVNLVRRSGDATGLDHALEVAANMFESQARGNSKHVLIVFTNGKSGAQAPELQQNSERLKKANVEVIMVAIGDDVDDDECQYVTCGCHPIINIAPEQNPRAVVYSIVGELEEAQSTEAMDIVFVLGAAGEGADTVYNKNKQIISKFIEANKVPYTMYSLVDYGPKAIVRSNFGENKQHAVLLNQIESLERPGEGKGLDKALEQSVNLLETQGRYGAQKRVIVFTNGKSGANPSNLKKYATLLEDSNVKVVTVAVGNDVNEEELRHINPHEEAIVKVDTDEETESAVFAVARQVQEPCKPKFDIIFAFGAMGDSADMIHRKEKEMIGSFIDSFECGDYRYGVVEYGSKASVKAKFDDIHGKEKMKEFVNSIHRSGEGKALDKALEQSYELFKKHGRYSARKVLIVFTNGKSNARVNELKKHAHNLNELNTKLIVVAVGDDVSVEELLEVTSNEEFIVRTQPEDDHQVLFSNIVKINVEEQPVTDVDVVVALGASGHHGDEMFEKEKEFVNAFIDSSKYGNMDYAVIQYVEPLTVHFRFKEMDDKDKVKDEVRSITRNGDGSSMAEALRTAHELFTNEGRPNSHKVLIIMMNGPLGGRAGELRTGTKALQKNGVKVITVTIGDQFDPEEVRQLSCDEENIIHVNENEDVGSIAYVITHQAVKGTAVHDEVVKEERFTRQIFLQPRIKFVIRPSINVAERRRKEEEDRRQEEENERRRQEEENERRRQEEENERRRQEEERLKLLEKRKIEEERIRHEELKKQQELKEEEERLEKERLELERLERETLELERKQKEEESRRKEIEEQKEKENDLEEEIVMLPFAIATPEVEDVKKAHRKTLDLEDTFAEKASVLRVSDSGNPEQHNKTMNETSEHIIKQETTSTVYINPATLQDDVLYHRDNTPEIRYSLKTDLNLDYEQGERGFVRDQIRNQETEIKRRSTHDPNFQSSLDKMLKSTSVTMVESTPDDDVFPPPKDEGPPPPEIPNVETRTVIYEPNTPADVTTLQMTGDPVVVTRRLKIDTTPVSQTTKTTHVVRHTSTPAEVVTKTITIEGDGEPLTAEELAEIMNMSGAETTTVTNSSYQRVERVQKVEQVVTSKQFVQSGQSFIVETGDPDADAAIMKALEDARKQDPNVKVAEVTITKQETDENE